MSRQDDIKFSKNVSSYLSLFVIGIVIVAMIAVVIIGYLYFMNQTSPVDVSDTDTKTVVIEVGTETDDVAKQLEEEGIISNAFFFEYYLKLNSMTNYQAGEYELSPSMDFESVANTILTGVVYQEVLFRVTIPEGFSVEQIADTWSRELPLSASEFIEQAADEAYLMELIDDYPDMLTTEILEDDIKYPLEGYLFPATYDVLEEDPSADTLIRQMLDATYNNSFSLFAQAGNYSLTIDGQSEERSFHEFLTLASIIEREATSLADRSQIASVFINRMALNPSMPLQTDPTVLYALGEHREQVLYEDLEVNDPYNTYLNAGLPPGPISNPGVESVQSTLNPSNTSYYYFLADSEGNNHFAETYEQHLENRALYINN